jgi:tetratricopeptide (TPR) repeat protein
VFWAGAVAQMGDRDPVTVIDMLRELSRKELLRPARRSSMQGEAEYAFWHILTRDVAYNQLPRASRASRHTAAAAWIEAQAPDRAEDHADVLAYHYATALDLTHATGQTQHAETLEGPARRFLTLAGQRALGLDTAAALTNLERALTLTPNDHPDRAAVLVSFAEAAFHAGRSSEAKDPLEEAISALHARGDLLAQSHAMNLLGHVLFRLADPRSPELPQQALALLDPLPPGPALVEALAEVASVEALRGRQSAAISLADRALALADELSLDRPARALGPRGVARSSLGDAGGLDDMREAIRLATAAGQGREVALLHNNLGLNVWGFEGPQPALAELRTGIAYGAARGLTEIADGTTASTLSLLLDVGQLDEALTLAGTLTGPLNDDQLTLSEVRAVEARIHALRGEATQAADYLDWLETTTRQVGSAEVLALGLGVAAITHTALGNPSHAATLLRELAAAPASRDNSYYAALLPALVRTAITLGQPSIAESLTSDYRPRMPYAHHAQVAAIAALAEAVGDHQAAADGYADAATRWEQFGVIPEHAYALQGHGRTLINLGHPSEATPILQHARDLFTRLGAQSALAETDTLLQQAVALSS